MDIVIAFKRPKKSKQICLPASKSISNRVLIINALADSLLPIENLADCDDTNVMQQVLNSDKNSFDIGHAGTAMRFLTAFLSRIVGRWELTGSDRMRQRPIAILVDALNQLGAKIEYAGEPGFPPLHIYGSLLRGGKIEMPGNVSSQYVSALMMIAPYMAEGLEIKLTGKIVSATYIQMTLAIMQQFGAIAHFTDNVIKIEATPYTPVHYRVESDWSAASYFYELMAVSDLNEILLPGLLQESLQGDSRQTVIWEKLGVQTVFEESGVRLCRNHNKTPHLDYDFVEMPDLVQSFAVACCLLEIPFCFSGIETLRIKETDRIEALIRELRKLGYFLFLTDNGKLTWDGTHCCSSAPVITTYHDHRMAMAFTPAAIRIHRLTISDSPVVTKSFPHYWDEMEKLGMTFRPSTFSFG